MPNAQDLASKIAEVLELAGQCSIAETASGYSLLAEKLAELETDAGQYLRSHTAYKFLLAKLKEGGPLTTDDVKTIRSLIIGDADQYLKYDDDFEQSKAELRRIVDQIRKLQSDELAPEILAHLRVLCREASSALVPTVHYMEQRQRVENFEAHMREPLGDDTRLMLANVIQDLAS
jgi:hypothetical protein